MKKYYAKEHSPILSNEKKKASAFFSDAFFSSFRVNELTGIYSDKFLPRNDSL